MMVGAELATALLPLIKALAGLIQDFILPLLTIALKKAAVGAKMLSIGAAPLIPILLAVVAVVIILAFLFAFLTGRSRELRSSLDQQRGSMDSLGASYEGMGNGLDHQIAQVSKNHNSQDSNVNVTIDARGDTPISEENAQAVADLLADRINRELGGKI